MSEAEDLEAALNKATRSTSRQMRFGGRAKHAVFFSSWDEARSLGADHVGGEHILLGLLGEEQALAAHVLGSYGLTLQRARAQVTRTGGGGGSKGRLDHNLEAQRTVELAQDQARALEQDQVETAHVLLALLGQRDGIAVGVVRDLGVEPERLRERVLAELEAGHGDYECYSKAAREVVARAEEEARQLAHAQVASEHLLLALLRDQQSIGSQVLRSRGVTPGRAREAVNRRLTGASKAPEGPIPLSHETKRSLELAEAEARSSDAHVNPEHIVLGLAGEAHGLAARVGLELAGDADELRNDIVRRLSAGAGDPGAGFFARFTEAAARVVALAQEEARSLEHDHIGGEHILLGLLREQDNAAAGALAALGIALHRVREHVVRLARHAEGSTPALLPFDPSATEVFRLAQRDARWLEHDHVGTDHLVLGVVRGDEALGARVLDEVGADRDALRAQTLVALGAPWASELSAAEEELSRREQYLREAQAWHRQATADEERRRRAVSVELIQRGVDDARAKLLPEHCHHALEVLVDHATEEWLKGQPPPDDPEHRRWYRDHCARNIHAQLIRVLFHPALGAEANPIEGHPGGPDAPDHPSGAVPFTLGS